MCSIQVHPRTDSDLQVAVVLDDDVRSFITSPRLWGRALWVGELSKIQVRSCRLDARTLANRFGGSPGVAKIAGSGCVIEGRVLADL
jgi:hypothetical protein